MSKDNIMMPVQSSTIRAIGYAEPTSMLIVEFRNGGTYVYESVPMDLHDKLMQADSHGKFLATRIKGKFAATRLPDPRPRECGILTTPLPATP